MALTQGDLSGALAAARVGLEAAKDAPVAVQPARPGGEAWARIGDREELAGALDSGRRLLELMPVPSNPRNHFVVDQAKMGLLRDGLCPPRGPKPFSRPTTLPCSF